MKRGSSICIQNLRLVRRAEDILLSILPLVLEDIAEAEHWCKAQHQSQWAQTGI